MAYYDDLKTKTEDLKADFEEAVGNTESPIVQELQDCVDVCDRILMRIENVRVYEEPPIEPKE